MKVAHLLMIGQAGRSSTYSCSAGKIAGQSPDEGGTYRGGN